MLKSLYLLSEDVIWEPAAMSLARSVWAQLSKHAKDRIVYVIENLLNESSSWYKELEVGNREVTFVPEKRM